ncbi:MAG: carboxypeptidase-like regulatory domain-containing protein [Flavobacteriaceae bacterium]|nr:carboxypeptidase-like regulatory domain-containing protein [Flavobacteriaceae bacterium]
MPRLLKETVLDQNTHSRIIFASIYFNGTFIGTNTDQNGYFELDISKNISMPLTISALGYYSVTLTDFLLDKPFLIYLNSKVYELEEIVITTKYNYLARKTD